MRRTGFPALALMPLLAAALAVPAFAHEGAGEARVDGTRIQRLVKADLDAGRIDFEDYLLANFRMAFAPETAPAEYRRADGLMEPCFTPWIIEFRDNRERLSAAAVAEIESYLDRSSTGPRAVYFSPSGKFQLNYDTAGANAVPLTDTTPANGVPDFVEMCAAIYDSSWAYEIDILGFVPPNLPPDGSYDCYFQALSAGLFGFTSNVGSGRTEITVDNDFTGFGHVFSPDPDGLVPGRARGVLSHEFKHASQFVTSGWNEGNWLELDANWVMDYVFDTSDIYHAWLSDPTSQLTSPQTRLTDDGDAGYYEDLLWETYMSERFGPQAVLDFWIRRDTIVESVKQAYQQVLQSYGSSWDDAYPGFMEWCWFTGSRSEPGIGFSEAANMARMNLFAPNTTSYPASAAGSVDELAAHHRRYNPGTATGFPRVIFDGDDAHCCFTVSVLVRETDGDVSIVRPALDGTNACDYTVPVPFADVLYVGVIVTNSQRSGGVKAYTLDVLDEPGMVGAPVVAAGGFPLSVGAVPNPVRGDTRIEYSLPAAATGTLRIHDVQGRAVRELVNGPMAAGRGAAAWDGRDAASRPVAAGVYWARLETTEGVVSRKITLIR